MSQSCNSFRFTNFALLCNFSDDLCDLALKSEETTTHAELDAGLVGHKSVFWKMVECRFDEGFPPDGVDGMTFAELIHHTCPLFHQNDTSTIINPSDHGHVLAEKLSSVRKDLKREYDAVMVNFMVW